LRLSSYKKAALVNQQIFSACGIQVLATELLRLIWREIEGNGRREMEKIFLHWRERRGHDTICPGHQVMAKTISGVFQ
jgi:hypothetical protein